MLRSYGKVYALGHKAIANLLDGPVVVEEKIDGSQFSFGKIGGVLYFGSRNQSIDPEAPPKDFAAAVDTVSKIEPYLREGEVFRAEVLAKPKHNTLAYSRVPAGNLIVFDIDLNHEDYVLPETKRRICETLRLECVPEYRADDLRDMTVLKGWLDRDSCLGGTQIEGVVIKNYARFTAGGHVLKGKYVSERFKEKHGKEWKRGNPGAKEIRQAIIDRFRTEARWEKAVGHLRDDGRLAHEPADIGPLMREIPTDFEEECVDEIKDMLWAWAKRDVIRGVTNGFPQWYKDRLAETQFNG